MLEINIVYFPWLPNMQHIYQLFNIYSLTANDISCFDFIQPLVNYLCELNVRSTLQIFYFQSVIQHAQQLNK